MLEGERKLGTIGAAARNSAERRGFDLPDSEWRVVSDGSPTTTGWVETGRDSCRFVSGRVAEHHFVVPGRVLDHRGPGLVHQPLVTRRRREHHPAGVEARRRL